MRTQKFRALGQMSAGIAHDLKNLLNPLLLYSDLIRDAETIWNSLTPDDWREAFAAHPRIGERSPSKWARQEQSGAASVSSDTFISIMRSKLSLRPAASSPAATFGNSVSR